MLNSEETQKHLAARVPSFEMELEAPKTAIDSKPLLLYVLVISLCAFPLGWDLGTTGNLMDLPSFRARLGVSAQVTGLLISVFNVGCIGGCVFLIFTQMTRRVGHLMTFRICLLVSLVGAFLAFCGYIESPCSIYLYSIGRIIQGISAGALCVVGPVFIDHLCTFSTKSIGFFALFQILIGVFVLCGNCVFIHTGVYSELVFYTISVAAPIFALACLRCLPESPRDRIIFCDPERLKTSLIKLVDGLEREDVWISAIYIVKARQMEEMHVSETKDGGKKGRDRKMNTQRLVTCCLLLFLQQMSGANFFFYFGKTMFDSLIVMESSVRFSGLLLSLCNLGGTLLSGFLVPTKGARKPLFAGLILMSLLLFSFATMGVIEKVGSTNYLGIPMLVTSCLFLFTFASTWGPCTAVISMEISQAHEKILSCAVICGWMTNVLVVSLFPLLVESLGLGAMYIFLVFTIVLIWTTRKDFYYLETSLA